MHCSLDGFVGGPNGEMNWITVNEEIFDFVATLTAKADTAVYGRVTYEMMQNYWPNAGDKPNASKHDKEHAAWYNKVPKVVLSGTLSGEGLTNTQVIGDQITEKILALKNQEGKNLLIFGSPRASHSLLSLGLVDEFWLFVNPVLLGKGIPLFQGIKETITLQLCENKTFSGGVIALHYQRKQE